MNAFTALCIAIIASIYAAANYSGERPNLESRLARSDSGRSHHIGADARTGKLSTTSTWDRWGGWGAWLLRVGGSRGVGRGGGSTASSHGAPPIIIQHSADDIQSVQISRITDLNSSTSDYYTRSACACTVPASDEHSADGRQEHLFSSRS